MIFLKVLNHFYMIIYNNLKGYAAFCYSDDAYLRHLPVSDNYQNECENDYENDLFLISCYNIHDKIII